MGIFDQPANGLRTEEELIGTQVEALLKEGKLLTLDETRKAIEKPTPEKIQLPAANKNRLTPTEIAKENSGPEDEETLITLHTATPARSVMALVAEMK